MSPYDWGLTPAQSAKLAEVMARPFRSDVGMLVCLRCDQTAERSRPSQGFAGTPAQCVCAA